MFLQYENFLAGFQAAKRRRRGSLYCIQPQDGQIIGLLGDPGPLLAVWGWLNHVFCLGRLLGLASRSGMVLPLDQAEKMGHFYGLSYCGENIQKYNTSTEGSVPSECGFTGPRLAVLIYPLSISAFRPASPLIIVYHLLFEDSSVLMIPSLLFADDLTVTYYFFGWLITVWCIHYLTCFL